MKYTYTMGSDDKTVFLRRSDGINYAVPAIQDATFYESREFLELLYKKQMEYLTSINLTKIYAVEFKIADSSDFDGDHGN